MGFSGREFRDACGTFATGVTVVTSGAAPIFHGMTANAFTSVSMEPPLLLVCVDKSTHMLGVLQETGAFTVNVLSADQEALSNYFANDTRRYGPEEFRDEDIRYTLGESGTPRLAGATCWFDCTVQSVHAAGDHDIYLGEVQAIEVGEIGRPLLFYCGRYRSLGAAEA